MAIRNRHSASFLATMALAIVLALAVTAVVLTPVSGAQSSSQAQKRAAEKRKKAAAAKKKAARLAAVTSLDPRDIAIGEPLTILGKNFTLGNNKMVVVLQRAGGKRFTARGTALNSTLMTVTVPDVSTDLVDGNPTL
ncbi:MAG: hypothetical protein JHC87_05950, partial [Thermoleophilaceae bacterium]|nr:hypothetical protein [Thermoleophilaceae bacterium]